VRPPAPILQGPGISKRSLYETVCSGYRGRRAIIRPVDAQAAARRQSTVTVSRRRSTTPRSTAPRPVTSSRARLRRAAALMFCVLLAAGGCASTTDKCWWNRRYPGSTERLINTKAQQEEFERVARRQASTRDLDIARALNNFMRTQQSQFDDWTLPVNETRPCITGEEEPRR